ncbi:hypothetical protein A1O3_05934 [Capronia epimyces CBS 606.96]|uniref:Transcription factor domain-containing protein n=1 Tax=Capronia epimyces CBS 606.96 TaxID=1182542 RepID=W9YSJ4_9EURO|nr:uncharacterized protein A1O3_05934 [Capronia epimyces CBS 606.96]EXJ85259.1 hypothetical protein A1O3_05934 [Capronia epimyces CBS 606.96]
MAKTTFNVQPTFFGRSALIPTSMELPVLQPHDREATNAGGLLREMLMLSPVTPQLHNFLVGTYSSTVHRLYPVLTDDDLSRLSEQALGSAPTASEAFTRNMVYSIACYCIVGHDEANLYRPLAEACHQAALRQTEHVTAKLDVASLRSITLLALHSLFAPHLGNCTQLIGIAARMCIDLCLSESREPSLHGLYISVLCIERQVALALDRPWVLSLKGQDDDTANVEPIALLYALLSIQSRAKAHISTDKPCDLQVLMQSLTKIAGLISAYKQEQKIPNLMSALRETEFALHPETSSNRALLLMLSYQHPGYWFTFLTPLWIFRGVCWMLKCSEDARLARSSEGYRSSIMMLDRASQRWSFCRALIRALEAEADKRDKPC